MKSKKVSDFFERDDFDRASSVMLQVCVLMSLSNVSSVLEVGPGRGNTATLLKSFGVRYESIDTVTQYVEPTYTSEFLKFSTTKRFDAVAAFQVFEHSPREHLVDNFRKCAELSRMHVVVSLPYSGNYMTCSFRAKLFDPNRYASGMVNFQRVVRFPVFFPIRRSSWRGHEKRDDSARHQWEVGDSGSTVRDIIEAMTLAGLSCDDIFLNSFYPYHCFFVARVQGFKS